MAAERLLQRAVTAEGAGGRVIAWDETALAFEQGFREALNLGFDRLALTDAELARADELARDKYASWEWTGRI